MQFAVAEGRATECALWGKTSADPNPHRCECAQGNASKERTGEGMRKGRGYKAADMGQHVADHRCVSYRVLARHYRSVGHSDVTTLGRITKTLSTTLYRPEGTTRKKLSTDTKTSCQHCVGPSMTVCRYARRCALRAA